MLLGIDKLGRDSGTAPIVVHGGAGDEYFASTVVKALITTFEIDGYAGGGRMVGGRSLPWQTPREVIIWVVSASS